MKFIRDSPCRRTTGDEAAGGSFVRSTCYSSDCASNGGQEDQNVADLGRFPDAVPWAETNEKASISDQPKSVHALAGRFVRRLLHKNGEEASPASWRSNESSLESSDSSTDRDTGGLVSDFRLEEAIEVMKSRDDGDAVMPENLQGGLDQTYVAAPRYLNAYLFEPDSHFRRELSEIDGIVGYEEAPWTWDREQNSQLRRLRRSVAYTRSATTFVKAVKVTEEQTQGRWEELFSSSSC